MAPKLDPSVNKCAARWVRLPTSSGTKSKHASLDIMKRAWGLKGSISKYKGCRRTTICSARCNREAAQLSNDLAQTRLLLFVESDTLVPAPFLAMLAFGLVIIFASFSLFSPLNVTVFTCLPLFALSAACAIFLILELSQPFIGLMAIPSAPLRNALGSL
jgi:hypothetical protein